MNNSQQTSELTPNSQAKTIDKNIKKILYDNNLVHEADISGNYKKAYSLYFNIKNADLLKNLEETIEYRKAVVLYN